MVFQLQEIVPWGRSYAEYVQMFALTESDLTNATLGCGDSQAGFNAVLSKASGKVISVDPLYEFSQEAIAERIQETFKIVIEQTRLNQQQFVWKNITSVEELGKIRLNAMNAFLVDYPDGLKSRRYKPMSLPSLAFRIKASPSGFVRIYYFCIVRSYQKRFILLPLKNCAEFAMKSEFSRFWN